MSVYPYGQTCYNRGQGPEDPHLNTPSKDVFSNLHQISQQAYSSY